MKKSLVVLGMVVALGMVANVAFSDETVWFPFWQHGLGIMSFWSVTNSHPTQTVTVTINQLLIDGTLHDSTTSTIAAGTCWQPGSYDTWFDQGDGAGFGSYVIQSTVDSVYLWGCVFAITADSQPGYTVILPQNPYGVP
jgi:hypothetical protein